MLDELLGPSGEHSQRRPWTDRRGGIPHARGDDLLVSAVLPVGGRWRHDLASVRELLGGDEFYFPAGHSGAG